MAMGMDYLIFSQSTLEMQVISILGKNLVNHSFVLQQLDKVVSRSWVGPIYQILVLHPHFRVRIVNLRSLQEKLDVEQRLWVGQLHSCLSLNAVIDAHLW